MSKTHDIVKIDDDLEEEISENEAIEKAVEQKWYKNWCYVFTKDKFISLVNLIEVCRSAFDLKYLSQVSYEKGYSSSPAKYLSQKELLIIADKTMYNPLIKERFFYEDKIKYLNTFRFDLITQPAQEYTPRAEFFLQVIKIHLLLICNENEKNTRIIEQWLAYNVQYHGQLLRWTPLISGYQGVGKTLIFSSILNAVLHRSNIGTVSTKDAESGFTAWAKEACVIFFEELRIAGNSRHQIMNILKPLLTNDAISSTAKGSDPEQISNYTNYFCCTNADDPVPITKHDRRWWVIMTKYTPQTLFDRALELLNGYEEIEEWEEIDDYFSFIVEGCREHKQALSKWLTEYTITKEFLKRKRAPMTEYKQWMVDRENDNCKGYSDAIEGIVKDEIAFCTDRCLSITALCDYLVENCECEQFNSREKVRLAEKLGYTKKFGRVRIDDYRHLVYYQGHEITTQEIQEEFKGHVEKFKRFKQTLYSTSYWK